MQVLYTFPICRGSALHQRLKDREIEEAADERDRQKEIEQIQAARRKLIEEGDPDAESIIVQMEQKMQEHLRKRLNVDGSTEPYTDSGIEVADNVDEHQSQKEPVSFILHALQLILSVLFIRLNFRGFIFYSMNSGLVFWREHAPLPLTSKGLCGNGLPLG